MDFTDQVAIVTGGAQGIGGEVATALADQGARLALLDQDIDLAQKKAASLSAGSQAYQCDVSDWEQILNMVEKVAAEFGRIDILVNSAGIAGSNATVEDYDVHEFQKIVAVNLLGTFHVNKAVIRTMRDAGYGRIVNIASVAGKEGNPNASAYSASKAGVIGFTKSLAKEVATFDIAVNCVTPAAARTRIFDQMKQQHIDYMLSKIPRNRFLELNEAAAMIVWLCSRENSFATGAVFDLSGGRATY